MVASSNLAGRTTVSLYEPALCGAWSGDVPANEACSPLLVGFSCWAAVWAVWRRLLLVSWSKGGTSWAAALVPVAWLWTRVGGTDGAGSSEASSTVALAVIPDASSAGALLGCGAVELVFVLSDC